MRRRSGSTAERLWGRSEAESVSVDVPAGRVLVVDDDSLNRMLLTRSLEQQGHRVGSAASGHEALEILREKPFDVVLLDIVMPELDGVSVLERLKRDPVLQHVPVIMISAVDEIDTVVRCIEMGAEDYLPKPFNPVLLRARINAALAKTRLREIERERVRDAIFHHGGTLVGYLGDGLLAVFGAPIPLDDHADRALAAAREMLAERLPRFNRRVGERTLGNGFEMGIGLNSGLFIAGNVGSARRLEYTVYGDTVNTASRIEGMTKTTRQSVLIADSTRQALLRPPSDLVHVGEFDVRGKQSSIRLWTI